MVTFPHHCGGACECYLHAICGYISADDKTICPSCCTAQQHIEVPTQVTVAKEVTNLASTILAAGVTGSASRKAAAPASLASAKVGGGCAHKKKVWHGVQ